MSLHKIIPWLVSIMSASEIKDITNTAICLLHTISYNTKQKSSMRTDKDQHFTIKEAIIDFTVVNFSFICSNIAATPVCRVYVSSVLMRFLCKTSHKDSCAWPCHTWHCQPINQIDRVWSMESTSTTAVVISIVVLIDLKKLQISILPEF